MIIPDVNLLVYAYNADAPQHQKAKDWWERIVSERQSIGLPWVVALGFVRIMTDSRILIRPMPPSKALEHIQTWMDRPMVEILTPGQKHMQTMRRLFKEADATGRLTTDIHLAAMAIEQNAQLHSNDTDFKRFSELRLHNPLA